MALALALATALLTALLAVAPRPASIPLIGILRDQSARAHHEQKCETRVIVSYPNATGLGRRGEPVLTTRRVCHTIAHKVGPTWADWTLAGAGAVGCGILGGAAAAASGGAGAALGIGCSAQVAAGTLASSK